MSINYRHPKLQTHLIFFLVYGFQQKIMHCTVLTLLTVTSIVTFATYRFYTQ